MAKINIKNRTIFCRDNIEVLCGINSDSVDLIYLDPPFNKKKVFTAPIGSHAEGAGFRDYFQQKDVKDVWLRTIEEDNAKLHDFLTGIKNIDGRKSYNYCYLAYMAIRLIECYRVLKATGSIYLHCDPTMSHYLKIVLDCIFGDKNFRNEIVWCYKEQETATRYFPRKHDIIFFYSKSGRYKFNIQWLPHSQAQMKRYNIVKADGRYANMKGKIRKLGRGSKLRDYWNIDITQSKERMGYPTQKPLALLEQIVKAGSGKGDVVLDPFCGCATTCIAAEKLERQWIGVDISAMAYELIKKRADKEIQQDLWDAKAVNFFTTAPKRTDRGRNTVEQKYVYVISNPQYRGYYKVGVAANAKNRLNSYQTGDPSRKYKLEFSRKVSNYRETEKHIHTKFENNHEWVRADLADIIKAIKTHSKK